MQNYTEFSVAGKINFYQKLAECHSVLDTESKNNSNIDSGSPPDKSGLTLMK
jgi:hypothetical protein